MAKKITEREFKATYDLAKQVYENQKTIESAISELKNEHQMHHNSAQRSVKFFLNLIEGKGHRRGLQSGHIKIYMEGVLRDYGAGKLLKFLQGLEKHIETDWSRGDWKMFDKRKLHNDFSERIGIDPIYESEPPHERIDGQEEVTENVAKSKFSRKFFVRNRAENPRQEGSWGQVGYDYFEYAVPLSYEEFKQKGGRNNDLQWDIDHNYIDIFDTKKEAENYCKKLHGGEQKTEVPATKNEKSYTIDTIMNAGCFVERGEVDSILQRLKEKKNLILQGPPGTGKTWLAKRLAYALIGEVAKDKVISVQFHPSMSYEDFVLGYRPTGEGKLQLSSGLFLQMINKAKENPNEKYVMVIEEINRGNPAQIFGELLTLLESTKRKQSEAIHLSYQENIDVDSLQLRDHTSFDGLVYIPENLYVVGTMNLADRSLALMDLALRRRFFFKDLKPEFNDTWIGFALVKSGISAEHWLKVKNKMDSLNEEITNDATLGKQFCIGHSFFTPDKKITDFNEWYEDIINTEIVPLLEEYWFEDNGKIEKSKTDLLQGL